jgi:two-component system, chemotaxis family, chemotaxis protein CheY
MKILIAEDELTSRTVLQEFLQSYGTSDTAVDGREALRAFERAWEMKAPYDLICLDIEMPEAGGNEVLKKIRKIEAKRGIGGLDGATVIMTSVRGDSKSIFRAFNNGCEAYIIKPVTTKALYTEMAKLLTFYHKRQVRNSENINHK